MSNKPSHTNWKAYSINEADVPPYTLPDPLLKSDGQRVRTAHAWVNFQRAKILQLFKDGEYGEILPRPDFLQFELLTLKEDAFDNTAVRKEYRIHCGMKNGSKLSFDLLLYAPQKSKQPVPAFLGLNFKGNHNQTPFDWEHYFRIAERFFTPDRSKK